jgi:hypothetical protein
MVRTRSWNFLVRLRASCSATVCRAAARAPWRTSAIECALTTRVADHIEWQSTDGQARFTHLCHSLASRGAVRGDTPPELIVERLRNILAGRPRLALDDAGQTVVRDWAVTTGPLIVSGAPLLLKEVEQRLESAT